MSKNCPKKMLNAILKHFNTCKTGKIKKCPKISNFGGIFTVFGGPSFGFSPKIPKGGVIFGGSSFGFLLIIGKGIILEGLI